MILEKIVRHKKFEVAERKANTPLELLKVNLSQQKEQFKKALAQEGVSVIAEVKKASPSKGVFKENFNPIELANSYEKAGAAAISVLTDSEFFKGSLEDLERVKENVNLPVLRKDFIIDSYQIYEAKWSGADAVLLIVAILEERELEKFIKLADGLGLDALVEVHTLEELKTALRCGVEIVGVNNRDLTTFKTDIKTTLELAKFVPKNCILVSESGISTREDVQILKQAGVDAILVGEALVTSFDREAKIKELMNSIPSDL